MTLQRTHPAYKLTGFIREVELPTGITVAIRKISTDALQMHVAQEFAARRQAAGSEVGPADQAALAIEITRRLLRTALIEPTLPELLELYGGNEEQDDLGMGDDLETLLQAIGEHSPQKEAPPEQAQGPAAPVKTSKKK